jgi:hypothetical protein
VPQNSSLINQVAMAVDSKGNPYITNYWDDNGVPQYKEVYLDKGKRNKIDTDFHTKPFTLKHLI